MSLGERKRTFAAFGDISDILRVLLLSLVLVACGSESVSDYYDSGKLKSVHEVKGELYDGHFKEYFESGFLKRQGKYKDGKLDGSVVRYFEEGSVELETSYQYGKLHGVSKGYFKNGNRRYETEFSEGTRIGWALNFFDEPNVLKERKLYDNNEEIIYLKTWDESGAVILNQVMPYLVIEKDTLRYDEPVHVVVRFGLKVPKTIVYFGLQSERLGLLDTLAVDTIGEDMSTEFNVPFKGRGRTRFGVIFSNSSPEGDSTNLKNVSPTHWFVIGGPEDESA